MSGKTTELNDEVEEALFQNSLNYLMSILEQLEMESLNEILELDKVDTEFAEAHPALRKKYQALYN